MAKKYRVYEVQVLGQMTRLIACDDLVEGSDELTFVADGVPLFRINRDECRWWQLTPKTARKAGVTRSKGFTRALSAFQVGRQVGKSGH